MSIKPFFETEDVKNALLRYARTLEKIKTQNNFEQDRNFQIVSMFNSFLNNGEYWDERTQNNIATIGETLHGHITTMHNTPDDINLTFAFSMRFIMEASLFSESQSENAFFKSVQDFGIYNIDSFDSTSRNQIRYSLYEMPISIVRHFTTQENVRSYRQFIKAFQTASELETRWANELNEKQKKVDELNETLKKQESAFNFVGLYAGFAKLGRIKSKELFWSRLTMFILGFLMPIPLILEIYYNSNSNNTITDISSLIKIIPIASITLILIYYFRVALGNYNSVRAQVMQIELRKSLCRFIQSYADYSKSLSTESKPILSKFEDVIFSNIMTSEEKTPSTFDGVEQIASLLSSIKGKQ